MLNKLDFQEKKNNAIKGNMKGKAAKTKSSLDYNGFSSGIKIQEKKQAYA